MIVAKQSRILWRDRQGVVAPLFAVSFVAICAVVGMAIDYGRAYMVRTTLQKNIDGAILAAGRAMADGVEDISAAAQGFFDATWSNPYGAGTVNIDAKKNGDDKIEVRAELNLPTTFMRVVGVTSVQLEARAKLRFGAGKAELVLVMDNTASMEGGRLADLKTAANALVETVFDIKDADKNVRVSLVPFSQYVNVGLDNRTKPWMSVPDDYSQTANQCYWNYPVLSSTNCQMQSFTGYNDGIPYTYQAEVCENTYGPPEWQCSDVTSTYTWNGCAGSRNYPLNTQDASYSTPIPGIMNAWCTSPVMPLSNKKTELKDAIAAMTATGNTYVPAGLIWGWRMLSTQAPFTEGVDPDQVPEGKKPQKVLVLMTDGANTISPTYPDHGGYDTDIANQLTLELCSNIKAAGVKIYTIAFDVTDPAITSVLNSCASGPPYYFSAATGEQLSAAFKTVASSVASMSLSE